MSHTTPAKKAHNRNASQNGGPIVHPVLLSGMKEREAPDTPYYNFTFSITYTSELIDPSDKKRATFYSYFVKIIHTDLEGNGKVYSYGYEDQKEENDVIKGHQIELSSNPNLPSLPSYRKRYSEIDHFDKEWHVALKTAPGANSSEVEKLYDELRLDPSGFSKISSPFKSNNSVKSKRIVRFREYINQLMSEPRLYPHIAKFLHIPLEVLTPPTYTQAQIDDALHARVAAAMNDGECDEDGIVGIPPSTTMPNGSLVPAATVTAAAASSSSSSSSSSSPSPAAAKAAPSTPLTIAPTAAAPVTSLTVVVASPTPATPVASKTPATTTTTTNKKQDSPAPAPVPVSAPVAVISPKPVVASPVASTPARSMTPVEAPSAVTTPPLEVDSSHPTVNSSPEPTSRPATADGDAHKDDEAEAPEAPLSYTKRKIKRKVHTDSNDPSVLSTPSHSTYGVSSSSPAQSVAQQSSDNSVELISNQQYLPSASGAPSDIPNPHWSGPSLHEWDTFINTGISCLKLPHSSGFLSKPKIRKFHILPLSSEKAQSKLTQAKKKDRFYLGITPRENNSSFMFEWNSSKNDVLDSFFILGDSEIPWQIYYNQKDEDVRSAFGRMKKKGGSDVKKYCVPEKIERSITIHYRDGSLLKTLDIIAESKEEFTQIQRVFTFIEWKQKGIISTEPELPSRFGGAHSREISQSISMSMSMQSSTIKSGTQTPTKSMK